jgi:PEGA domain
VLHKALAKDPNDRYLTCEAFVAELTRALNERPGWMLPGRGFPGEESTTGSGHHSQSGPPLSANTPTDPGTPRPAPVVEPPPAAPAPAPAAPDPFQKVASFPTGGAAPTTGPIPVARRSAQRLNPLLFILPAAVLLGGGGFLAYQKLSAPKPVVGEVVDPQVPPEVPKPEEPKVTVPPPVKPATPEPKPAEPPVVVKPPKPDRPATEEHHPVDPGLYLISFTGTAGTQMVVDSSSASSCRVPCSLPLSKGRHGISGILDGYQPFTRAFEVSSEATIVVDLTEARGILVIQTKPPGATILLNGQERPEKTPAELRLKAGKYEVVLVNRDGRRDASSVTVKDGVIGHLSIEFP